MTSTLVQMIQPTKQEIWLKGLWWLESKTRLESDSIHDCTDFSLTRATNLHDATRVIIYQDSTWLESRHLVTRSDSWLDIKWLDYNTVGKKGGRDRSLDVISEFYDALMHIGVGA